MSAFEDIRNERLKKLELLKEKGVNPFPVSAKNPRTLPKFWAILKKLLEKNRRLDIVGRIMALTRRTAVLFF